MAHIQNPFGENHPTAPPRSNAASQASMIGSPRNQQTYFDQERGEFSANAAAPPQAAVYQQHPYEMQPPRPSQDPYLQQHPYYQPQQQVHIPPPQVVNSPYRPNPYEAYAPPPEKQPTLSLDLDAEVRANFAKKVFAILSGQLLYTLAMVCALQPLANFWENQHGSVSKAPGFIAIQAFGFLASLISLALICAVSCKPHLAREVPKNYWILGGFTMCQGFAVGAVSMCYTTASVWIAIAVTASVTLGLMLYAWKTKSDFTGFGPYLFAGLIVLVVFSIVLMIMGIWFSLPGAIILVLNLLFALLFSMYIVYDTQLILGGKHRKHEIGVDDYVFGAITIYLDIINLFLVFLRLLGNRRD